MTVPNINPTLVAEGRTLLTLDPTNCPPGSDVVVGPVFYPKPTYSLFVPTAKPTATGFWQCFTNENPWKDAVAWWNGTGWEGSASEISQFSKPGVMRKVTNPCGARGKEVWPDPAVVIKGVSFDCTVTVIVHDAPAEMVVIDGGDCFVELVGSANSSRVHGNRPLVLMKNGYDGDIRFTNPECAGQPFRVESGANPRLTGSVRCLSLLSDAGGYVAGRGLDVQGSLHDCDLDVYRLPRLTPTVGWGTAALYADDGASGVKPGRITAHGFDFAGVIGGGSDDDFSQVTGGPVWVEDRSAWAQLKDWKGIPARPWNNTVPQAVQP